MAGTDAANETVLDVMRAMIGSAAVGTVFGTPITQDGVTVIPVARVSGGGGGGDGTATEDAGKSSGGAGGGFGLSAKPAGVYVIRDGRVSWRPAVDVNKVILGGQILGIVALLTIRVFLRARRT